MIHILFYTIFGWGLVFFECPARAPPQFATLRVDSPSSEHTDRVPVHGRGLQ
jgi:hypothetical protein